MGIVGIKKLQQEVQLKEADLAVATAMYKQAVLKAFIEAGVDLQTHTLCLDCGSFTPNGSPCECKQ